MVCWQTVDTSHIFEGALCQFEQCPDMCDPEEIFSQGFDDITGVCTNPEFIKQARNEEMNGFRDVEVYECVSREETSVTPAGTVVKADHNEGTSALPEVRSRLVAQEFRDKSPTR